MHAVRKVTRSVRICNLADGRVHEDGTPDVSRTCLAQLGRDADCPWAVQVPSHGFLDFMVPDGTACLWIIRTRALDNTGMPQRLEL